MPQRNEVREFTLTLDDGGKIRVLAPLSKPPTGRFVVTEDGGAVQTEDGRTFQIVSTEDE